MAMNPLSQLAVKKPQKFARGRVPSLVDGIVRGPGGPTEDKVDAKVSPQEAILPAKTVQAIGGPAAVKALIERTNDGQAPESEVRGGGKYADGAVPSFFDDVRNALARPDTGLRQDVNALSRMAGDFSGVSRKMPDIPPEDQAAYAAQKPAPVPLVQAAKPVNPNYSNEPNAPANAPAAPQVKPLVEAAKAAPQGPAVNTQIGDTPPANPLVSGVSTIGTNGYMQQLANIRAMNAGDGGSNRSGPPVGMSWDAEERQRKRDFDNFSARSDLQRALYDASRSGDPRAIQAAGNALTSFNAQADGQWNKSQEFDHSLRGLAAKGEQDRALEGVRGENMQAIEGMRGQNGLAQEALRGRNLLDAERVRSNNQLAIASKQAETAKLNREYVNPLDAQLKQQQLQDAQVKASLLDQLIKASPDQQQEIARRIAAMDGRYADKDNSEIQKARIGLIGDLMKAYNGPNGVPVGADRAPMSFEQFAAPALAAVGGGGGKAAPSYEQYAQQIRARNPNHKLTDEQIQSQYAARYGNQ